MAEPQSVTRWIRGVEQGDPAAAHALWQRYYAALVRGARRRLEGFPRRVADEEDVVQSAFRSFYRAAREGRFPHLADRHDLWRLLIQLTARKAVDLIRYNTRHKRWAIEEGAAMDLDQVIGDSPSPEFAAQVADQCRHLFGVLGDPGLEQLAAAKLEGWSNAEIARDLGCSVRTVERRLHLIRRKWEAAGGVEP